MAMRDMIPKLPDWFDFLAETLEGGLLFKRIPLVAEDSGDSAEPVFEVPFPDFGELVGRQVIFQKYKNEVFQRAAVDENKPHRRRPIQSVRNYGNDPQ